MSDGAVRVGLVGLGTIGTGLVTLFQEHGELVDERLGFPLELVAIADIDLERDRGVSLDGYRLTREWRELLDDPGIEIMVELVGGTGVAKEIVLASLAAGKHVVTANKALLASCGEEVFEAALSNGREIAFEASVGGTIPVLRALREGLCADRIESLAGIVNGTCNYILSQMDEYGEPYEACLKRAQDLGYAEADPTFDVDGTDSRHKLTILLGLALGVRADSERIACEGIERIAPLDIEYARRFGLRIKLLALAKLRDGEVEARVHPTMIPQTSVLAGVDGSMNAIEVRGRMSGPTLYYGAGAGALPTASAVLADAMELARGQRQGASGRVPPLGTPLLRDLPLRSLEDLECEYYLRFSVPDRPGVLAGITGALATRGISVASLLQPERHASEVVPVVITTHMAKEAALRQALAEIAASREVGVEPQVIRIEREI